MTKWSIIVWANHVIRSVAKSQKSTIRAEDAYPKCIMRKRGEDISILSDKNCAIISDPYPTYESQDTGIYKMTRLLAPADFQ